MGLFSGGFLGGGTDESSTTTKNVVTTNTSTVVRDIGITGGAAVDFTNVLSSNVGNILGDTIQASADLFKTTVGNLSSSYDAQSTKLANVQQSGLSQIISAGKDVANPALSLAKGNQYILIAGIAALALILMR